MSTHTLDLTLDPDDSRRLSNLCGQFNEHIRQIEEMLSLTIRQRGNWFQLSGSKSAVNDGSRLLESLYLATEQGELLSSNVIHLALQEITNPPAGESGDIGVTGIIRTPRLSIKPRSKQQAAYVNGIERQDLNFSIGPAGTGKTYLAVACAVQALVSERVNRIVLVRPAVEAGEKLGFLPGDLIQKIDPYLRPLYDALYEMLGFEKVNRLVEKNVIEVAPLAYMRGRTLNESFIILDESQNATTAQMKMFLTRIGVSSRVVVTGDITQIDLPAGTRSGLVQATQVLRDVDGIGFTWFTSRDVVRHRLVQSIVEAYEGFDQSQVTEIREQDAGARNESES
ncbi:MAG: PhoH family protein [Gammaproteobacteria bacterium]|nr:PhoH family protein [Gammaproteobacteria bacterium]MCY3690225.1 PhoH family protein [Gammaproteobacteria bacterium]